MKTNPTATETATEAPWIVEGNLVYQLEHCRWDRGVEKFRNKFWISVHAHHDKDLRGTALAARICELLNKEAPDAK